MGGFMKTTRDVDVAGRRVLVRVDFNVTLEDGVVAGCFRGSWRARHCPA